MERSPGGGFPSQLMRPLDATSKAIGALDRATALLNQATLTTSAARDARTAAIRAIQRAENAVADLQRECMASEPRGGLEAQA